MRRLLTALAAFVLLAPPAQAAPQWHDGEIESSTVTNCNFFPEKGINNLAQFQADPAALPKVGDTFYVRMLPARTGNGCGIGMHVHPEIVLPVGVELAITGTTPVRCLSWDYLADVATPLDGCPQTPQAGAYGPSFDQETARGRSRGRSPHLRGVVIEIPLRSSRPLKGAAGRPASCVRVGRPAVPRRADRRQRPARRVGERWAARSVAGAVRAAVRRTGRQHSPAPARCRADAVPGARGDARDQSGARQGPAAARVQCARVCRDARLHHQRHARAQGQDCRPADGAQRAGGPEHVQAEGVRAADRPRRVAGERAQLPTAASCAARSGSRSGAERDLGRGPRRTARRGAPPRAPRRAAGPRAA